MATLTGYYNPLLAGVLGGSQSTGGTSAGPFSPAYASGPLSQLAYQMAGSPQRGPFADQGTPPAVPGYGTVYAGATGPGTGGGAGSAILGALPYLAKNPKLVKSAYNAVTGLLSPSPDYGSGAAADNAIASQLGNVANDGTAAAVQASNDAALAQSEGNPFGAPSATAQPAASTNSGVSGGSSLKTGAGDAMNALGIYEGVKQGGVTGYGQAAVNAAQLGSRAGVLSPAIGQYAGDAAIPLALYNEVKNWQSGNTGSDALSGAETGAAIGSVVPGIGTIVGGLVGGAAGALSSAFGGGRPDTETTNWNNYVSQANQNPALASSLTPSQAYQNLAGVMDAKNNSAGHSEPIEQVFGRAGEGNLMDQMTAYINQQQQAGSIKPGESVADQWTNTVYPWLQSKGASINPNQNTSTGQPEGQALINDLQNLIGQWEGGVLTPQSQVGINGQTIQGLLGYSGMSSQPQAAIAPAAQLLRAQQSIRATARNVSRY